MKKPAAPQPGALARKGIQVKPDTYSAIVAKKAQKELDLAKIGKPREVTHDEIIAEALGVKRG